MREFQASQQHGVRRMPHRIQVRHIRIIPKAQGAEGDFRWASTGAALATTCRMGSVTCRLRVSRIGVLVRVRSLQPVMSADLDILLTALCAELTDRIIPLRAPYRG